MIRYSQNKNMCTTRKEADSMELCKKHDTATAYIFSQDFSSILIVDKRFSEKQLPPGGHVEPGETFLEAVYREIYEETGVSPDKLQKCHFDDILQGGHSDYSVYPPTQDEEFIVLEKVNASHYHIDHIYCFVANERLKTDGVRSLEIKKVMWTNISDITPDRFYPNVFDTILFFGKAKK